MTNVTVGFGGGKQAGWRCLRPRREGKQLDALQQGHSSADTNFPVPLLVGDAQFQLSSALLHQGPLFSVRAALINQHVPS